MAKVEPVFQRRGKTILDMQGNTVEGFKSISQAKKWSGQQQKANGGLGMGYIKVIKKGN